MIRLKISCPLFVVSGSENGLNEVICFPAMITENELDKFLSAVSHNQIDRLIREEIAPYTCQLLHRNPVGELRPYASGVWIVLDGTHYLLTAGHVIEEWRDEHPLFVEVKNGYSSISGKGILTHYEQTNRVDVGCIRLLDPLVVLVQETYHFWNLDKFFNDTKLEIYNYCIYGFDEKRKDEQTLDATATANFVKPLPEKVFNYYQLKPEFHYIVESRGEGLDLQTGKFKKENITPHGMSGSGLWYVHYVQHGNTYIPSASLIGILTEYRTGRYQCLIANRTQLIRDLIRNNPNDFLFP